MRKIFTEKLTGKMSGKRVGKEGFGSLRVS